MTCASCQTHEPVARSPYCFDCREDRLAPSRIAKPTDSARRVNPDTLHALTHSRAVATKRTKHQMRRAREEEGTLIPAHVAGRLLAELWRGPVAVDPKRAPVMRYLQTLGHDIWCEGTTWRCNP